MSDQTPPLAPPGAGLPPLELWLDRLGFRLLRTLLGRERIRRWLMAETRQVLAVAGRLSEEQARQPVLIPRLTGLEDSSRHWSAGMVVQHLVIVDTGIADLLEALGQGHAFGREVRIAEVKPSPGAGLEQLPILQSTLEAYLARLAAIPRLRTGHTHAHPWFGPLDAHGWHALAALHTRIHRRQLEAVVRRVLAEAV